MSHNNLLSLARDIVLNILSNWINILDIACLDNALTSTALRAAYLSLGSTNKTERLSCNVTCDEWNKYENKTRQLYQLLNWLLVRGFGLKSLRVLFDVNLYEEVLKNVEYLHGSLNQHTVSVIAWSRLHLVDVRLLVRAYCDLSPVLELVLSTCQSIRNIEFCVQPDGKMGMMIPPSDDMYEIILLIKNGASKCDIITGTALMMKMGIVQAFLLCTST